MSVTSLVSQALMFPYTPAAECGSSHHAFTASLMLESLKGVMPPPVHKPEQYKQVDAQSKQSAVSSPSQLTSIVEGQHIWACAHGPMANMATTSAEKKRPWAMMLN